MITRSSGFFLAALAICLGAGCSGPSVSARGLALRKVVVYRNGVGYFQRAGRIDDSEIRFKVKATEIGDFLATFAVMERGGSSVRSASFPLEIEKRPSPRPRPMSLIPPAPEPDNGLRTVVMRLDGRRHDLEVGYIAETPVWRPSYRLVVDGKGATLQAWGVVQNLSGEDWKNVALSLVAEAPVAFQASLGTPVIPARPTVNDSGDVIAVVPQGETSFAELAEAAAAPELDAPAPPAAARVFSLEAAGGGPADAKKELASKALRAAPAGIAAPRPAPAPAAPSRTRNVAALAAVAVEGGATRYDLPQPVTIPDNSATMVLLLDRRVAGEAIYLFAPDGGVPLSASHPFRVARMKNETGGLLERGPIAVFADGAFVGQGLLEPLPADATATVPFALERGVGVEQSRDFKQEGARLAKVELGQLEIERDAITRSKYKVKNGLPRAARLLVKHPRVGGARLHAPPPGTEDNTGAGSALVPVEVPARATKELTVDERLTQRQYADWMTPEAEAAITAYADDRRARPDTAAALRAALAIRKILLRAQEDRRKLADEQAELARATEETRDNLRALAKVKTADDLRARLTERLAKAALRLDEITKRLVEVDLVINEQGVRFQDAVRAIKILEPLPSV